MDLTTGILSTKLSTDLRIVLPKYPFVNEPINTVKSKKITTPMPFTSIPINLSIAYFSGINGRTQLSTIQIVDHIK